MQYVELHEDDVVYLFPTKFSNKSSSLNLGGGDILQLQDCQHITSVVYLQILHYNIPFSDL